MGRRKRKGIDVAIEVIAWASDTNIRENIFRDTAAVTLTRRYNEGAYNTKVASTVVIMQIEIKKAGIKITFVFNVFFGGQIAYPMQLWRLQGISFVISKCWTVS